MSPLYMGQTSTGRRPSDIQLNPEPPRQAAGGAFLSWILLRISPPRKVHVWTLLVQQEKVGPINYMNEARKKNLQKSC